MEGEIDGEVGERLSLPREEEALNRVVDSKLPSPKEVEDHRLMGHVVYRNWCPICVKAMGRDMRHFREQGKRGSFPNMRGTFAFRGMSWE